MKQTYKKKRSYIQKIIPAAVLIALLFSGCAQEGKDEGVADTASETVTEQSLAELLPEYEVSGKATVEGSFITCINDGEKSWLVDFLPDGSVARVEDKEELYYNGPPFAGSYKEVGGKDLRYAVVYGDLDGANYFPQSELIMFDKDGNGKIIEYDLDGTMHPVEPHDAIVIDENNWIVAACIKEETDEYGPQLVTYIQEVKDGSIIWEFRSSDYPYLYESRISEGDVNYQIMEEYEDTLHINSMFIDPRDGNLLVSARNHCAVYKISRETGGIMWIFGGKNNEFEIDSKYEFRFQHSVSITDDGNLLLYDNSVVGQNSRILEFKLDGINKKAEIVNELVLDYSTINYGSVSKLSPDTYLIHTGITSDLDRRTGFYEVNRKTGEELFSVTFDRTVGTYGVYHAQNTWN